MNFIHKDIKKTFLSMKLNQLVFLKKSKNNTQKINGHLFYYLTFFSKKAFIPFILRKIIANVLFKITKK